MNLVLKYELDVIRICRTIDKVNYKDLAQDVYLKMIESEPKEENIVGWIFTTAKNIHLNNQRNKTESLEDLKHIASELEFNYEKELERMLIESDLDHTERLWIRAYLENNLSYSTIENRTSICRQCASKRINAIINKIQCNLK